MMDDEAGSFLQSILAILTDKLLIAVLVLAVLGILLIVGYILYNQLVFKKKFAAAPAVMPVASIIEEIAPTDMP